MVNIDNQNKIEPNTVYILRNQEECLQAKGSTSIHSYIISKLTIKSSPTKSVAKYRK